MPRETEGVMEAVEALKRLTERGKPAEGAPSVPDGDGMPQDAPKMAAAPPETPPREPPKPTASELAEQLVGKSRKIVDLCLRRIYSRDKSLCRQVRKLWEEMTGQEDRNAAKSTAQRVYKTRERNATLMQAAVIQGKLVLERIPAVSNVAPPDSGLRTFARVLLVENDTVATELTRTLPIGATVRRLWWKPTDTRRELWLDVLTPTGPVPCGSRTIWIGPPGLVVPKRVQCLGPVEGSGQEYGFISRMEGAEQ
jgi:hypothetical protein